MQITIIAAIDKAYALGKDNQLAWHLPNDLKFFKQTTLHSSIVMGRKTFESFGAKPLPNRTHILISRQSPLYTYDSVIWANSIEAAIEIAQVLSTDELFIIGGGEIYSQTIEKADRIILTHVHTEILGADVFFPQFDQVQYESRILLQHEMDSTHAFSFHITEYLKKTI